MERVVAYIDGFNLYFGMKSKGWRRYLWLDLQQLCQRLLKPGQSLQATKYFTSRVSPTPSNPHKGKRQGKHERLSTAACIANPHKRNEQEIGNRNPRILAW